MSEPAPRCTVTAVRAPNDWKRRPVGVGFYPVVIVPPGHPECHGGQSTRIVASVTCASLEKALSWAAQWCVDRDYQYVIERPR